MYSVSVCDRITVNDHEQIPLIALAKLSVFSFFISYIDRTSHPLSPFPFPHYDVLYMWPGIAKLYTFVHSNYTGIQVCLRLQVYTVCNLLYSYRVPYFLYRYTPVIQLVNRLWLFILYDYRYSLVLAVL